MASQLEPVRLIKSRVSPHILPLTTFRIFLASVWGCTTSLSWKSGLQHLHSPYSVSSLLICTVHKKVHLINCNVLVFSLRCLDLLSDMTSLPPLYHLLIKDAKMMKVLARH